MSGEAEDAVGPETGTGELRREIALPDMEPESRIREGEVDVGVDDHRRRQGDDGAGGEER